MSTIFLVAIMGCILLGFARLFTDKGEERPLLWYLLAGIIGIIAKQCEIL
jgi:hypothetical protein